LDFFKLFFNVSLTPLPKLVKSERKQIMTSCTFPHLGKINSQKQNEAEPRPQTCSSFEYAENTIASEQLPDWGGEDPTAETQDKVPRMCAYSAGGGSDSDSDLDYGNNGFGAGRGKLVKARKSTTQGNLMGHLDIWGSSLSRKPLILPFTVLCLHPHP